MRENRTYGSEGGEAQTFPTPIAEQKDEQKDTRESTAKRHSNGRATAVDPVKNQKFPTSCRADP